MIRVVSDRVNLEVTMAGHADAPRNAENHDLVCCAASVLIQALVYWAQQEKHVAADGNLDKGNAHVTIKPAPGYYMHAKTAYKVMERGLEMLQKAHPECISIEYV